ncbi:MAG: hypothetical protein ACPL6D_03540 [Thermodesulfobacteriota bacterium]
MSLPSWWQVARNNGVTHLKGTCQERKSIPDVRKSFFSNLFESSLFFDGCTRNWGQAIV